MHYTPHLAFLMEIISDNLRHYVSSYNHSSFWKTWYFFASVSFLLQPYSEGIQQSIRLGNAIVDTRMCLFNSTPSPKYPQRLLLWNWLSHHCSCLQHAICLLFLAFRNWIKNVATPREGRNGSPSWPLHFCVYALF